MTSVIHVFATESEVVGQLGALLQKKSSEALTISEFFKVGVSGGSLVKFLCSVLPSLDTDWSKWRIFFCDERVVPFDDKESTYGVYRDTLIGKVPLLEEQFVRVNPDLPLEEVANDYIQKLKSYFPGDCLPKFDVLLLGMGPDGHTCSLFPGHKALQEKSAWVTTVDDSPKPPPSRITLTFPVINNASTCMFVSTGAGKAEIIKKVLEGKEVDPLPAALVQPTAGELHWILDEGAASLLSQK